MAQSALSIHALRKITELTLAFRNPDNRSQYEHTQHDPLTNDWLVCLSVRKRRFKCIFEKEWRGRVRGPITQLGKRGLLQFGRKCPGKWRKLAGGFDDQWSMVFVLVHSVLRGCNESVSPFPVFSKRVFGMKGRIYHPDCFICSSLCDFFLNIASCKSEQKIWSQKVFTRFFNFRSQDVSHCNYSGRLLGRNFQLGAFVWCLMFSLWGE